MKKVKKIANNTPLGYNTIQACWPWHRITHFGKDRK